MTLTEIEGGRGQIAAGPQGARGLVTPKASRPHKVNQ